MSVIGFSISILISGFVSSVYFIVKSVCSKFPSNKVSIELKNLSLISDTSANEIVEKDKTNTDSFIKNLIKHLKLL